jgi:signal transduction histidine kinase
MRALVFTPSGRDGALLCQMLERAGIDTCQCRGAEEAAREMARGAGALIVADEALTPALIASLTHAVKTQPGWSDFPLILLTSRGAVTPQSEQRREMRHSLGNVLLLERPVRPESMLSTVQGALRARQRQYEVREQVEQYRRAEGALRKAEKLALAGRLAASIAHEINNPLTAVTNLHYLMARSESMQEIKGLLAIADDELARVAEIAKQTLKFHRESSRSAAVDLRDVIDSVLALYRGRLLSAGIEVTKEFHDVTAIEGFAGELRQVFANLVGNALDAMWSGGHLWIRIRAAERDGVAGVRVTVADSGAGIPAAIRPQLFEPFVSTKGNTGTGLGLWVAAEIVHHHAGSIRLRSRERVGTVFTVFLPGASVAAERVSRSA